MALKVFQRGNFIITDNGQENSIPIDNFDYQFIDTTLKLKDVIEKNEVSDSVANVQDESGSAIGDQSAIEAYFATFIKQGSAAPAVGGSTAANQLILNDQTAAKQIGYVIDLSIGAVPPYDDVIELIQNIKGIAKSYPSPNEAAADTEELAQLLNDLQTDIFYGALDATKLFFVPVTSDIIDITEISIEDGNEGVLSFVAPYAETTDVPTGALHQLVTLMQKQSALLRANTQSGGTPVLFRLVNPSSIIFSSFRFCSFVCDAVAGAISVTMGGGAIAFPYTMLDGSLNRGVETPLLTKPSSNSITFNGTGTVDVTIVY